MATEPWLSELKVGSKVDFRPTSYNNFQIGLIKDIEPPNRFLIAVRDYDSDDSDYLLDSEWIDIGNDKDKQRIASFNTIAVNLILCTRMNSWYDVMWFGLHKSSIIATNTASIRRYEIETDQWTRARMTNDSEITTTQYTKVLVEEIIYFLFRGFSGKQTKLSSFNMQTKEWKSFDVNDIALFRHSRNSLDEGESSSAIHFKEAKTWVDACYDQINEVIYILSYTHQLIKLRVDESNKTALFETISTGLSDHFGLKYVESLQQLITVVDKDIVCYDTNGGVWRQYQHKLQCKNVFTYTLICDHIIVVFEKGTIWFYDLLFDAIFQSTKQMPEIPYIDEMAAINHQNEHIHLIRVWYRLFGSEYGHVKLRLDDIIPSEMEQMYQTRKEMLCTGFVAHIRKDIIPLDIVWLITSFITLLL